MIPLVSGANNVILTLKEMSSLPYPYYLFVFVNDSTKKKVACTATELSTNLTRYNRFTLTVKTSPNPLNGEINLINYGFYHYYIYEMTAGQVAGFSYSTIDNLDLSTLTGEVEIGKMKYTITNTAPKYYKNLTPSILTYGR